MYQTLKKKPTSRGTRTPQQWAAHLQTGCVVCHNIKILKKGGRPIKKRSHGRRLTNEPCYWGQENFKKLVEECPVDSITLDISIKHLDQGHNPHLNFCVCQLCEELIRRPILATDCEHQFCMNCLFPLLKGVLPRKTANAQYVNMS